MLLALMQTDPDHLPEHVFAASIFLLGMQNRVLLHGENVLQWGLAGNPLLVAGQDHLDDHDCDWAKLG